MSDELLFSGQSASPYSHSDPGLQEMEFELIDAEQFSTLDIDLVIVDKSKRYLGGGLLFEREQGLTRSGNLRILAI